MKYSGFEINVAEDMRCCNSCYARNYDEEGFATGKRVDKIFLIRAGQTVTALCEECTRKLIQAMEEALKE